MVKFLNIHAFLKYVCGYIKPFWKKYGCSCTHCTHTYATPGLLAITPVLKMFTTTGYHTNFLELPPALIMNASCIQPWCVRPIYSNAYKIGLLCTHKKDWGHMEYHRKSIIFSMDFIKLKHYFNLHVCMSFRASHIISSPYLLQMHCHWQSRAAYYLF